MADINVRIDHYFHNADAPTVDAKLDQILAALAAIQQKEDTMLVDISALITQVQNTVGLEESCLQFIQSVADMLKQANGDQAQIDAAVASLQAKATEVAAALAANPLPAPPAPPAPPPAA